MFKELIMFNNPLWISFCIIVYINVLPGLAIDRYVVPPGTTGVFPSPGYTSWATAATNIQAAVDAAVNGDVVYVSNGIYYATGTGISAGGINMIYINKGITLQALSTNPLDTIIDGCYPQWTNRCLRVSHNNAVVDGFTIMRGYASDGGGIVCGASSVVQNCRITDNICTQRGAGVYCSSGGLIRNCTVSGNTSLPTENIHGGAIFVSSGGTVRDSDVMDNLSSRIGGGILCQSGGMVYNCHIYGNMASNYGGGVFCYRGGDVQNCVVASNCAGLSAGGVSMYEGGRLASCLVFTNTAQYAGGIDVRQTGVVQNCTVTFNAASTNGGIRCIGSGESSIFIENTVIYYNYALKNTNWGNSGGIGMTYNRCCTDTTNGLPGSGNITNEPGFRSILAGDYRLIRHAPCFNAGLNQDWMTNAVDLDGNVRIFAGTVDIGCYERVVSQGTIFVFWGR